MKFPKKTENGPCHFVLVGEKFMGVFNPSIQLNIIYKQNHICKTVGK